MLVEAVDIACQHVRVPFYMGSFAARSKCLGTFLHFYFLILITFFGLC